MIIMAGYMTTHSESKTFLLSFLSQTSFSDIKSVMDLHETMDTHDQLHSYNTTSVE
jgi:hypothetical protein